MCILYTEVRTKVRIYVCEPSHNYIMYILLHDMKVQYHCHRGYKKFSSYVYVMTQSNTQLFVVIYVCNSDACSHQYSSLLAQYYICTHDGWSLS